MLSGLRCNGDWIAVTFSVAATNANMAPRVSAMIKTVVRMEAKICFMEKSQKHGRGINIVDPAGRLA
jgi:hypothetical protein